MAKIEYTKEDKKIIKRLKAAGQELTGEESSEELATLNTVLDQEEGAEGATEAEEIDGVPNKLPVQSETISIAGKDHALPVFFVATVKGGKKALYDYEGRRVSPAYGAEDRVDNTTKDAELGIKYVNKACAKFNAMRRRNIIPGEANIG